MFGAYQRPLRNQCFLVSRVKPILRLRLTARDESLRFIESRCEPSEVPAPGHSGFWTPDPYLQKSFSNWNVVQRVFLSRLPRSSAVFNPNLDVHFAHPKDKSFHHSQLLAGKQILHRCSISLLVVAMVRSTCVSVIPLLTLYLWTFSPTEACFELFQVAPKRVVAAKTEKFAGKVTKRGKAVEGQQVCRYALIS
jgi:hypothetical protein